MRRSAREGNVLLNLRRIPTLWEHPFVHLVNVVAPGQSVIEDYSQMFVNFHLWYRNASHRYGGLWCHTFQSSTTDHHICSLFSALNSIPQISAQDEAAVTSRDRPTVVVGEGGCWPCPFLKNVKMTKRKKRKKKEEAKNTNSNRHDVWSKLHFVSRTEGEIYARFVLPLFGGRGPSRCLEGSVPAKTGKFKRANKATPTRHLPVLPNAFDIDFTWGLPLSFPTFLEAQVRCATECPADDERAFSTKGAQQVWEKALGSWYRFQAWSCDSLRHWQI